MDTKKVVSESEEIRASSASSARVDEGAEGVAPWLDFTSSIVDSLIWPIIILFLALFFRSSIRRLLDRIASVSWGDKHVKFDRVLEEAREQVDTAILSSGRGGKPGRVTSAELLQWISQPLNAIPSNPRQGVIDAWLEVESALEDAAERLGVYIPSKTNRRPGLSLRLLMHNEHISEDWVHVFRRLRQLRNEAAHDRRFDLTSDRAEDYVRLCADAIFYLRHLSPNG